MSRLNANLLKYGISVGLCGGFTVTYIIQKEIASQDLAGKFLILCDAFTVPGVLLLMIGVLVAVSNSGFFNGLAYCVQSLRSLIPGMGRKQQNYHDFLEERGDKHITGYGFLFVVGGAFLAIALVFFALFYRFYP